MEAQLVAAARVPALEAGALPAGVPERVEALPLALELPPALAVVAVVAVAVVPAGDGRRPVLVAAAKLVGARGRGQGNRRGTSGEDAADQSRHGLPPLRGLAGGSTTCPGRIFAFATISKRARISPPRGGFPEARRSLAAAARRRTPRAGPCLRRSAPE